MIKTLESASIDINNDAKILASALYYERTFAPKDMIFITNDLAQKTIAGLFFDSCQLDSIHVNSDEYTGYIHYTCSDDGLVDLYQNLSTPPCDMNINQYLIVHNKDGEIIDKMCWTGEKLRPVKYYTFYSRHFGEVKPKSQDIYQTLAMDSLVNNQITMLKGPAGTGKTWLSLAYLFSQLEKHKIDKIIIFCNTVATKNSAKLGFYPGSRDEKLLDSQIGNMLASKLGDKIEVEKLIADGSLVLLPMSDVRGYDTSGMRAGVYISEAQNLDIDLMKLTLQRIGDDSICIIDGDCKTQVDDVSFAGANNGMRRASQVFRGNDIYGEITLKNIHRSKIALIAENM
jgi:predicted ribonuclease YlaK